MANTNTENKAYILKDISGMDLKFKNFSGRVNDYNPQGKRTFNIILPEDVAADLQDKGWRIKMLASKTGDLPPVPSIKVNVKFGILPPKIYLVTSKKKELLTEETCGLLDGAEIIKADIMLSPYVNTKAMFSNDGLATAYLKTGYFTIEDDPFEDEYAELG